MDFRENDNGDNTIISEKDLCLVNIKKVTWS